MTVAVLRYCAVQYAAGAEVNGLGGTGGAGDSEDAGRGTEPADAGCGREAVGGEVPEQSAGRRVLANELIATRLAEAMGLTVPKTDVVEVTEWLIAEHGRR